MELPNNDNVHKNIENLTLALFQEQIKITHTQDITTLMDYCVNNIDKLSILIIMLVDEMKNRLEKTIEDKGWDGMIDSAEQFGLTTDHIMDSICSYFSDKRGELGLSRDKLMQIMMKMQSLEKTHRKFQQDNEGENNGS